MLFIREFNSSEWKGLPLYFSNRFSILIPVFSLINLPSCPVTLHSTNITLFAFWISFLICGESGLQYKTWRNFASSPLIASLIAPEVEPQPIIRFLDFLLPWIFIVSKFFSMNFFASRYLEILLFVFSSVKL